MSEAEHHEFISVSNYGDYQNGFSLLCACDFCGKLADAEVHKVESREKNYCPRCEVFCVLPNHCDNCGGDLVYKEVSQSTPERIWISSVALKCEHGSIYLKDEGEGDVEYVRSDVALDRAIEIAKRFAWPVANHDIGAHDLEDCATCASASQASEIIAALEAEG